MIVEKEKGSHIGFEPISFERPLSRAYWYSKSWSRELPNSVRLTPAGLRAMNRTLEPETVERTSRAVLERLCEATGMVVHVSPFHRHKKQVKGFIAYSDSIWDQVLEARLIKFARLQKPVGVVVAPSKLGVQSAEPLLRDLEAMLEEEDEPDFLHRPSQYAYDLTKQLIKDSYTHYVGFAPSPTIAPDGNGGASVEWISGDGSVVRLIVPASQGGKLYIYTKDSKRSHIDYEVSGLVIAQQLRSVFKD